MHRPKYESAQSFVTHLSGKVEKKRFVTLNIMFKKHSTILLYLNKKSMFHNQQKPIKNISTVNFQENIPGERRVSAS